MSGGARPALGAAVRIEVEAAAVARYEAALEDPSTARFGFASPLYAVALARAPFEELMVSVLASASASAIPIVIHLSRDMAFSDVVRAGDPLDIAIELTSCREQGGRSVAAFRTEIARDGRRIVDVRDVAVLIGDLSLPDIGPDLPQLDARGDRTRPIGDLEVPADIGPSWAEAVGDHQSIHLDDDVARVAGFERAIAHGSYTFAAVTRDLLAHHAGGDGRRLRRVRAGFARAVYPGERLRVEATPVDDGRVGFRARARGRAALRNGTLELAGPVA